MSYQATFEKLMRSIQSKEFVDSILALIGGGVDYYLMAKGKDTMFLIKNIGIPVLDILGFKLPKGLTYQSYGSLGMLIGALVS